MAESKNNRCGITDTGKRMNITQRRYKLLSDFVKVLSFLEDVYNIETLNSYLLPQFFEYAHTHQASNHKLTHRFGLWEERGELIGVACYEMNIGEVMLSVKNRYGFLLPDKCLLVAWINNEDCMNARKNGLTL